MKRRRRYVAFGVTGSDKKSDVYKVVVSLCRLLGADRTQVRIIHYDSSSQRGLFLCNHRLVSELKAAIKDSNEVPLRILGVSGTIRAAKRKFLS